MTLRLLDAAETTLPAATICNDTYADTLVTYADTHQVQYVSAAQGSTAVLLPASTLVGGVPYYALTVQSGRTSRNSTAVYGG